MSPSPGPTFDIALAAPEIAVRKSRPDRDKSIAIMKKINKKLEYNTELMLITMEECGELVEACSKAVRCEDYTIDKLTEEAGDVLCMIELMKEKGILNERELQNRINVKKMKLMK